MIVVYSKPNCVQCDATQKEMDRREIPYTYVDITKDSDAMEKVMSMGYKQAPVVVTESDHWSGFRPDKIMSLKSA